MALTLRPTLAPDSFRGPAGLTVRTEELTEATTRAGCNLLRDELISVQADTFLNGPDTPGPKGTLSTYTPSGPNVAGGDFKWHP